MSSRLETAFVGLACMAIAAIPGVYVLERVAELWDKLQPGQGEFLGQILTAFAFIAGLMITLLIFRYETGKEERQFRREKKHAMEIAARAHLPQIERIAFSTIDYVRIWTEVHSEHLASDLYLVDENHMLNLPVPAFDIVWPEINDGDIAGLPTAIVQQLYALKTDTAYQAKEWAPKYEDLSSRHMRLAGQIVTIGSALNLRFQIRNFFGLQDEEDQKSKDARELLKNAMDLAKQMNAKYIEQVRSRTSI